MLGFWVFAVQFDHAHAWILGLKTDDNLPSTAQILKIKLALQQVTLNLCHGTELILLGGVSLLIGAGTLHFSKCPAQPKFLEGMGEEGWRMQAEILLRKRTDDMLGCRASALGNPRFSN